MNKLFETPFTWDNRKYFLCRLPHRAQVQFGLFCANQVKCLMKDERSLKALEVTQAFLDGKATKEDCLIASATNATYAATAATYATYAANAATYATYAATYAAANAAAAATYAANAADAAAAAEQIKQEQLNYLRELIIDNLSSEDRDCWLLVTSF